MAEPRALSHDEEKMPEWLAGFLKIEHIIGTPGVEGSVSDVYFNTDGQEIAIRETITEIIPNESVTISIEPDFMDMDYTLTMSSLDGTTTKINSSTIAAGNGMF